MRTVARVVIQAVAMLIVAAALLWIAFGNLPTHAMSGGSQGSALKQAVCRASEVAVQLPADYEVPVWDDSIGAQVGVWTGSTVGFSYQEDGLVYRTANAADICPVYREQ